jgi:hypothetical protein
LRLVLLYLDPEVEFHPGLLPPGEGTRYVGHEGVREWIRSVTDTWVELPTAYTFRNGLVVRVDGFTDKSEALKAVGLDP